MHRCLPFGSRVSLGSRAVKYGRTSLVFLFGTPPAVLKAGDEVCKKNGAEPKHKFMYEGVGVGGGAGMGAKPAFPTPCA